MTMSDANDPKTRTLAALRGRIDAIDEQMHRLLIERGAVIGALIESKGAERPGAAFRPAREADMMSRIAGRHQGELPLATVEHIWREIIATFTCMQARFEVAIDLSVEPDRMRDLARFMFGFSIRLRSMADPAAVIERVAGGNDLGIVARDAPGPWWLALKGDQRPTIMAILPFIRADERPAELPAFVVSPPLADPTPADMRAFAVSSSGPLAIPDDAIALVATEVDGRRELLLADAAGRDTQALAVALRSGTDAFIDVAPIGGFARPIDQTGKPVDLAVLA